jgi:hypothetical protein
MMNDNDRFSPDWLIVDRYKNITRDNMPMDETITSFSDRIIELFEMVNEANGGAKTVENKTVVYQIPVEQPAPVINLSSIEDQKKQLHADFEKQIVQGIGSTEREERARAAYMAVCLDMSNNLSISNPKQWRLACSDLSGYWKIMENIFYASRNFEAGRLFGKKFEESGFTIPPKRYSTNLIYSDPIFWKDPKDLY